VKKRKKYEGYWKSINILDDAWRACNVGVVLQAKEAVRNREAKVIWYVSQLKERG
jgi:hypothetical protein